MAKLFEIANVVMGTSPPGSTVNETGKGLPLLNGPTEFGEYSPTPVQYTTSPLRIAHAGDLLFCVRGSTTGRMNWATRECAIGRGLAAIRPKAHPELASFIRAIVEVGLPDLLSKATGSTFPSVSRPDIENIDFTITSLAIQKEISLILGSLDDKIELNRQMNETLEAMARRLFKSWFVDFDPVHKKAAARQAHPDWDNATLSRHALPHMHPEIAELFPDRFEESSLGLIPAEWEATIWGKIATLEYGKSLKGYQAGSGDVQVFGTNGPIGWTTKPLCESPGIIIGRKGAYRGVHFSTKPFFVIDTAFYLKPVTAIDLRWAYLELIAVDINSMDSGSAIPSTSREDFYQIPVNLPPSSILKAFGDITFSLYEKTQFNDAESQTLTQTRDKLLPRLLSGELSVAAAEDQLQEVV